MPAKMVRKVLPTGDSKAIALPPDWLRMFKLKQGDYVEVVYNAIVIIKPPRLRLDTEFLRKELELIAHLEEETVE